MLAGTSISEDAVSTTALISIVVLKVSLLTLIASILNAHSRELRSGIIVGIRVPTEVLGPNSIVFCSSFSVNCALSTAFILYRLLTNVLSFAKEIDKSRRDRPITPEVDPSWSATS